MLFNSVLIELIPTPLNIFVLPPPGGGHYSFIRGNLFKGKAGIQQEAAYDPATKKYSTKIYPTINNLQVPKDGMTVSFGRDSKTMFGGLEVGWVGAATNAFDSELVKKALKEMDIDMATQTPRTVARGAYNFATGKDCVQLLPKTVDELKIALAYSRVHENPVILQLKDDQTINKGGSLWVFVNYGFPNDPKLQIIDPTTRKQISLQLDTLLPQVAMVMGPK